MIDYTTVQSVTLKAIIAMTSFADGEARARLDELIQLDDLLRCSPERLHFAGAVRLHQLRQAHPVVTLQLEAELRDGTILSPEAAGRVAHELRLQKVAEELREQERAELERRARDSKARRSWIAAGGQA